MSWPLASHFSAMLQNPKIAFRDPQLQRCRVEKDHRNQPRPWAGSFAVVYKAYNPDTGEPFAVRVFTTESPERRERYDLISAYLRARRLECLVEFEYRDRSIRSAGDGKWYPLILMQWVQGETLFKWVRARCLEGDGPALARAAERWVDLVNELGQAAVAHSDLQHANVMVTDVGELRLVDYDGMCVPALVGRRNLEIGVEPYQHPSRNESTLLALDLDSFSALVIYVALKALAVRPELWHAHVEATGYDKLLMRREDFRAPDGSALYRDLMNLPDPETRELAGQLFRLYRARADQVPALGHLVNSYGKVEALLREQRWAEAVQLLNRRGQFRDAPEHLRPLIHRAYENVCRQQAWDTFQRVPREATEPADRDLVNAWNESLFAGFAPAERERIRVAEARRRVDLVDRLRYAAQQSSGVITAQGEQRIVDAAALLPQGYRHGLRGRVEQARRRVAAIAKLARALQQPSSEAAIVAAWYALLEADGRGLAEADRLPRIELAEQRAPVLKALGQIPAGLPEAERDRRIIELWDERLLADCAEAARWRRRYQAAVARRETAAQELQRRSEALLAAIAAGDADAFRERFDARLVRRDQERFKAFWRPVLDLLEAHVLQPPALGLGPADGRKGVSRVEEPPGSFRVRWSWPAERVAERCVLGVSPEDPSGRREPDAMPLACRMIIDRRSYDPDSGVVLCLGEDAAGAYVAAWAVVDLGFDTVYSPAVVLGRVPRPSRWNWRKWPLIGSRGPGSDASSQSQSPQP